MPKPQTPFQWHGQDSREELERKVAMLRQEARLSRGLQSRWHEPSATVAEGILSRGDRRLGPLHRVRARRAARVELAARPRRVAAGRGAEEGLAL